MRDGVVQDGVVRQENREHAMGRAFWCLWALAFAFKAAIAARLPLFVDEAFYWWESRHPAAAYSDLPGLTAWLARLGTGLGGEHPLALRAPFLLIAAALPLLVRRIAAREYGERAGAIAGCFAILLPLGGTLGLLALPDVAMTLATVLCVDAGARLLRGVSAGAALELAAGLAIGALSHYRYAAVIGVGFLALLSLPAGRRALRDPRSAIAIAIGAAAWAPLALWNMDNADAGLRFQLVDRHPWAFHADGLWFVAIQAVLVTPPLLWALAQAAWRGRDDRAEATRYFARLGGWVVLGFFALGFFADRDRVSFHWPLPGYYALLPLLPAVLDSWPRWARRLSWIAALLALVSTLAYYVAVSVPGVRALSAAEKWYPSNFAGWDELAQRVRERQARMPAGTGLLADNFKLGAELGFALGDARIPVLDHPLNHKHGRAPQLRLWGLHSDGGRDWGARPTLLVVGATDVEYKHLLDRYQALCAMVGPLPPPETLNVDHGRQRFVLFALDRPRSGGCTAPAMAWIDAPLPRAGVGRRFAMRGWAFKDGVGVAKVEATLDGRAVGELRYGLPRPDAAAYWAQSRDAQQPNVGFEGEVALDADVAPGRHWLGLRLHGRDGSVEDWPQQPVLLRD